MISVSDFTLFSYLYWYPS